MTGAIDWDAPESSQVSPTWTVLVATLGQRHASFQALLDVLMPQVDAAAGAVRVLAYLDDGQEKLGAKRQALVDAVTTPYLSFVDDDDLVSGTFVADVLAALEKEPDIVGFWMDVVKDGRSHQNAKLSLEHDGWYRGLDYLCRDITHEQPMKTELARLADFREHADDQPEDSAWADKLRATGRFQRQEMVEKALYTYLWVPRRSTWKHPERIKTTDRAGNPWPVVLVSSPWFDYHPASRGWSVTAGTGDLTSSEGDAGSIGEHVSPLRMGGILTGTEVRIGEGLSPEIPMDESVKPLLVIVPSKGRPQNVARLIQAWEDTEAVQVADLRVDLDADDPALPGYLALQPLPPWVQFAIGPKWKPMVHKLNRAARQNTDRFALGFMGDDHCPRTIGWAREYVEALRAEGTGIVYSDDGYQHENLCTEWAMTADIVRALGGRMVPARVDHLYSDVSVKDLGEALDRLIYLAHVNIEHVHPAAGKTEPDAQYRRVNGRAQYARDKPSYRHWRARQMAADVRAVQAIIA